MAGKVSYLERVLMTLGRLPGLGFLEQWRIQMVATRHRAEQQIDDLHQRREDVRQAGDAIRGRERDEEPQP